MQYNCVHAFSAKNPHLPLSPHSHLPLSFPSLWCRSDKLLVASIETLITLFPTLPPIPTLTLPPLLCVVGVTSC